VKPYLLIRGQLKEPYGTFLEAPSVKYWANLYEESEDSRRGKTVGPRARFVVDHKDSFRIMNGEILNGSLI
jgi:hypothetical protein